VVVDEPSVVAINKITGEVIAFGNEARKMQGREARDVAVIAPLVDGKFVSAFVRAVKPVANNAACCAPGCCD